VTGRRRFGDLAGRLAARYDEVRAADAAVVRQLARTEAGPNVPAVPAREQVAAPPGPSPAHPQAHLVERGPGDEDALRAAVELHVVVSRPADARPAEDRVRRRVGHEGHAVAEREHLRRAVNRDDPRGVSSLVERSQRVDVLRTRADPLGGEPAGAAVIDRRTRLEATDPARTMTRSEALEELQAKDIPGAPWSAR